LHRGKRFPPREPTMSGDDVVQQITHDNLSDNDGGNRAWESKLRRVDMGSHQAITGGFR
jgi:hypothetical protein